MGFFQINKFACLPPLLSVALALSHSLSWAHGAPKEAKEAKEEAPATAEEPAIKPGYVAAQVAPIPSPKAPQHPLPWAQAKVTDLIKQLDPQSLKKKPKKGAFPFGMVELAIEFKGDSDQLADSSAPLLDSLSNALKYSRLVESKYVIEGHTESRGSTRYSFTLTKQQADAVKAALLAQGVDGNRLRTEGKGFKEPQDERNPLSKTNRRIRVVLVSAE
jgi:outer membrane protein OmpA-like peptidoglycan-associated protein